MATAPAPTPHDPLAASGVGALLGQLDEQIAAGGVHELERISTGFDPLDQVLGGGFHAGDLMLLGGSPGAGKTIMSLQAARNLARNGVKAVYVCYEHEEVDLLVRLLLLEMGSMPGADDPHLEKVTLRLQEAASAGGSGLMEALADDDIARTAYERVESYKDRLFLVKGSGRYTGVPQLDELVSGPAGHNAVLFVDYLQKVALDVPVPDEAEKVTRVTEDLKDLALSRRLPVVAVVAADQAGLKARRLRMHHLRGSSALAYEADVILILNEKFQAVSDVHRAYDPLLAKSFRDWVVLSVEKNRGGPALIDMEFRKDFAHFRFEAMGRIVSEKLVDDSGPEG